MTKATFTLSITIPAGLLPPNDGGFDPKKIEEYLVAGGSPLLTHTQAKKRGNIRYQWLIEALGTMGLFEIKNIEAVGAGITTDPTLFRFTVVFDRADAVFVYDDLNPGEILNGYDAVKRVVARAIMRQGFVSTSVYDPTKAVRTFSRGPSEKRLPDQDTSNRVLKIQVGGLAETLTEAEALIDAEPAIVIPGQNNRPSDIFLSAMSFPENIPSGTVIATVSGSDPDNDELIFRLLDDAGGMVALDGTNLLSTGRFNYELLRNFEIKLRAIDPGNLFIDKIFPITITNVNEAPLDITLSANSIAEHSPAGTLIGTFTTTDTDSGNTFTYALTDTLGGLFQIVDNQLLTGATATDYVTASNHVIEVTSTDQGSLSVTKSFTINVTNVNEAPTDIVLSSLIIKEASPNGTVVGTLSTTDPDPASKDSWTYRLVDSAGDRFRISGSYLLAGPVGTVYATAQSHDITVEATDSGGLKTTKVFTIAVTDGAVAPVDIILTSYTIAENSPEDTLVGLLSAVDQDADETFTYELLVNAGNRFKIVGNELRAGPVSTDYETAQSHVIRVQVTDSFGLTFTKYIGISVVNVNEEPSNITLSTLTYDEYTAQDITIATISTVDQDAAETFTYTLLDDAGGRFKLKGNRIVAGPTLSVYSEATPSYPVTIQVTDKAGNTIYRTFNLSVSATSTNVVLSNNTVLENSPYGTVIGTLSTINPDPSKTFAYSIIGSTGSRFAILGDQLVAGPVKTNFEGASSHTITVRSTDTANATNFYDKEFIISVVNVDEAPTNIILSSNTILERSPAGTVVGTLTALDDDIGDTFTFAINGTANAGGRFKIVGNEIQTDEVQTHYATATSHKISVVVTDSTGRTFAKDITISVLQANKSPTNITLTPAYIVDGSSENTLVGTLTASDPDVGETFTYEILDTAGSRFKLIDNTILAGPIATNRATATSHIIQVRVTDSWGNTYTKSITIAVQAANSAPINLALTSTNVVSRKPQGTIIGTLSASDPDGDSFVFSLVDNAGGRFALDVDGVTIRVGSVLPDYAVATSHTIQVDATDANDNIASKVFTITVLPAFTEFTFSGTSMQEGVAEGTPVGTITATHALLSETITYTLVDNAGGRFKLNGTAIEAGAVATNYATGKSHNIQVKISDSLGNEETKTFTITVLKVTLYAPSDIILWTTTINEKTPANTLVSNITAVDDDVDDEITFSLVTTAGGRFKIVNNQLYTDLVLTDFETGQINSFMIRATDAGGRTFDKSFTITVVDINEAPTNIYLSSSTVKAKTPQGVAIGTFTAQDEDAGDSFSYTLVNDAGGRFQIDGNELQAGPTKTDYTLATSHIIEVEVSDSGSLTFTKSFVITVSNDNLSPTDIILTPNTILEGSPTDTLVGTLTAVDGNYEETFTFQLLNDAGSRFKLVNGNEIRVATVLTNYETAQSHNIQVRVTDSRGATFTRYVAVNVLNVNEPPINITLIGNTISEYSNEGDMIGTLVTTDGDTSDTFTYSITNDFGGRFMIMGDKLVAGPTQILYADATSYSLEIVSTDSGGLSYAKTFAITVNATPSNITLTANAVTENVGSSVTVGTLATVDPDGAGKTYTYTLTDNAGGRFNISGTTLITGSTPINYEAADRHTIIVRSTDQGNLWIEREFTIVVRNAPENPTDITLTPNSFTENSAEDVLIGTLTTTDEDAGNTFTYAFNSANPRVKIVGDKMYVGATPTDFETTPSFSVSLKTTDNTGRAFNKTLTVNVLNENEVPSNITLSTEDVKEKSLQGALVGTFTTTDPDAGDTFTYLLMNDAGGRFQIIGNELQAGPVATDWNAASSHTIQVQVTDAGGLSLIKIFNITVVPAPSNITLSANTVAENTAASVSVGTLTTTWADGVTTPTRTATYTLEDNAGGRFKLVGSAIQTATVKTDYETATSHSITVKVTDAYGATFTKVLTINVTNVAETATDITLSSTSFTENSAENTPVGTLTNNDPDFGDSFTYSIVSQSVTNALKIVDNQLLVGSVPTDHETNSTLSVTIRVTDSTSRTFDKTFTINVLNANEAPYNITLSNSIVDENKSQGTLVGTLVGFDYDAGDSLTFSLQANDGGRFQINGNRLEVGATPILYLEGATRSVTVRVTDASTLFYDKTFTITVRAEAGDPNYNNVIFLSGFESVDGTTLPATDESTYARALTYTGVTASTAAPLFGSLSALGVTTTGYASTPFTPDMAFGADDFTIEAWVYFTSAVPAAGAPIVSIYSASGASTARAWSLEFASATVLRFLTHMNGESLVAHDASVGAIATNKWHHIAVERKGYQVRLYMNGNAVNTLMIGNTGTGRFLTVTEPLRIGHYPTRANSFPGGYIDEVRITKGGTRYWNAGSTYTVPTRVFPRLHTNVDPVDIVLGQTSTVPVGSPQGTFVGRLTTTDETFYSTFTYTLTDNAGGRFQITDDMLEVGPTGVGTLGTHSVTVRSTDSDGLFVEKSFTITVETEEGDPNFNQVVFLTGFDGNKPVTDESLSAKPISYTALTSMSKNSKFGSTSLALGSANNGYGTGATYAWTPDSSDFAFGQNDAFTIEFWINWTSLSTGTETLLAKATSGVTASWQWAVQRIGNVLRFQFYDTANAARIYNSDAFTPTRGQWYHIAIDRTADGTLRFYVDGVMIGSRSAPIAMRSTATNLAIGAFYGDATLPVTALFDEVRITKGVARYATNGNFSVPSRRFPRKIKTLAPTDIVLSSSTVYETEQPGFGFATITTVDPNLDSSFTYSLQDDAGGRFAVSGNTLQVGTTALTAGTYNITIRSTDPTELYYDEVVAITVEADPGDPYWEKVVFATGFDAVNGSNPTTDGSVVAKSLSYSSPSIITYGKQKFGSRAMWITATTDYATVADHNDFTFKQMEPFTMEAWVYFETVGTAVFLSQWDGNSVATSGFNFDFTTNLLRIYVIDNNGQQRFQQVGWSPPTGVWHHVAVDRTADGTLRFYINGVPQSAGNVFAWGMQNSSLPVRIGTYLNIASTIFTGSLDDIRYTKGVARYAGSTFAVPTRKFMNKLQKLAPTDVTLTSATIYENAPQGWPVGTLSVVDPNAENTFTYTLTNSAGGRFQLNGKHIEVGPTPSAISTQTIGVRVTDKDGLFLDKNLDISVIRDETDLYPSSVVFLTGFDHLTDLSVSAKTLNLNSNTNLSSTKVRFGTSALRVNANQYVFVLDSADFTISENQSFTFETWVNFDTAVTNASIMGQYNHTNTDKSWIIVLEAGVLKFIMYDAATVATTVSAAWAPSANTWYHIAADRTTDGTVRLYVNGTMLSSITGYTGALKDVAQFLGLGTGYSWTATYWAGYMDETRLSRGVARYASDAGYTVPTQPFDSPSKHSLLLKFNTDFTDSSAYNANVTATGTPVIESGRLRVSGNDSYLQVPVTGTNYNLSNGAFTIEFRYQSAPGAYSRGMLGQSTTATTRWLFKKNASGQVEFHASPFSTTLPMLVGGPDLTDGIERHIAVTRQGNIWRLFVDGVLVSSIISGVSFSNIASNLMIGTDPSAPTTADDDGYFDDVRISRGTALYTSDFEVPWRGYSAT